MDEEMDEAPLVTVFLTKYCLSKGIIQADGCTIKEGYAHRGRNFTDQDYVFMKMDRDAFLTEKEAIQNAITRGRRRQISLDKEVEKIGKLERAWRSRHKELV